MDPFKPRNRKSAQRQRPVFSAEQAPPPIIPSAAESATGDVGEPRPVRRGRKRKTES